MKKGLSTVLTALIGIVALVIGLGIGMSTGALRFAKRPAKVTYEGEFDTFQAPQEVSGSDLSITEQDLNQSGVVEDGNVALAADINGTDLETHYLAWGVEIDGSNGMENIDVEASIADASSSDQQHIEKAYILRDREGVELSEENAVKTLEVEDGEVDAKTGALAEGEYVFVLETSGTATENIANDQNLFNVDLDANTEGDNDVLSLTIDNAA